jgi:hypothetical protein
MSIDMESYRYDSLHMPLYLYSVTITFFTAVVLSARSGTWHVPIYHVFRFSHSISEKVRIADWRTQGQPHGHMDMMIGTRLNRESLDSTPVGHFITYFLMSKMKSSNCVIHRSPPALKLLHVVCGKNTLPTYISIRLIWSRFHKLDIRYLDCTMTLSWYNYHYALLSWCNAVRNGP